MGGSRAKAGAGGLGPGLLAALGFIAMVSSLSTDLYLPSLTSIAADLDASPALVQLTLSAFFFGIGSGQIVLGAISDRRGRRTVLLVSLAVFALTGLVEVFAQSVESLIALRLVQGFAGASGLVLSRAIAADLSRGETAVRALSLIAIVSGLGPLLAPVIGGITHEWWGWRGSLATLGAVSAAMLLLAWRVVPESLPPERRHTGGIRTAFGNFGRLLRDRRFTALAIGFGLSFASVMAYISASPFVGQRLLGMSPLLYAFGFAAAASAMLLSNLVNSRVAPRIGPARMLAVGVALSLIGATAMLALVLADALTVPGFIASAFVLTSGGGLCLSNTSALALAQADFARGSGSALLGAIQFLCGGLAAPFVGLWGEGTALPMALLMVAAALCACLCTIVALRTPPRAA